MLKAAPLVDAQTLFASVRNDYGNFLKLYREYMCLFQKLEMLEAQLQDVIAIPCGSCGHTFNNCAEAKKKQGTRSEKNDTGSPRSVINKLFEEVKGYLEEYNSSTDSHPVSATLTSDNSLLFCKLQKPEKSTMSSKESTKPESPLLVTTKSKPAAAKPAGKKKLPVVDAQPNIDQHFTSSQEMQVGSPPSSVQMLPPMNAPTRPNFPGSTQNPGTDRLIQIRGAGNRTYLVGWEGHLNQFGLPECAYTLKSD